MPETSALQARRDWPLTMMETSMSQKYTVTLSEKYQGGGKDEKAATTVAAAAAASSSETCIQL